MTQEDGSIADANVAAPSIFVSLGVSLFEDKPFLYIVDQKDIEIGQSVFAWSPLFRHVWEHSELF